MARKKISTARSKDLGKGVVWREDRKMYRARMTSLWEVTEKGKPKIYEHWSKDLADCQKWLNERRYEDEKHISRRQDITVSELFKEWDAYRLEKVKAGELARNTVRNNEERWKMNIAPILGRKKVRDVKHPDCEKVITKMGVQGYRNGTIYMTLITMMELFKYAREQRIITESEYPADGLTMRKEPKGAPKAMTVDEQQKFIAAIPKHRAPEYIFLLLTGLRAGECIALTWDDVYLDGDFPHIHVNKSMEYRYSVGEWVQHIPKHHEIRDVPLCEEAVKLLKEQMAKKETRKCASKKFANLVFLDFRTGEPRKNSTYDTYMDRMCKKAGIRHYSVHGLRHTFATRCVEAGVQPETLAKILGHKSIKTTLDKYYEEKRDHTIDEFSKFSAYMADKKVVNA